jgi:hypothetical protein
MVATVTASLCIEFHKESTDVTEISEAVRARSVRWR